MTTYRFRFSEVFPVEDPVARWLVTLSMGFNDVIRTNSKAEEAIDDAAELLSSFRLASLHLWEIAKFITDTHSNVDEVRAFVDDLPKEAQENLAAIKGLVDTGAAEIGKQLVQIRDLLAHYPEMKPEATKLRDPVSKAMKKLTEDEAEAEIALGASRKVRDLSLSYADDVVAAATLNLIPTEEEQRAILGGLAKQVGEVSAFVQRAVDAWLESRMDKLTAVEE
jgi:hypothetical protein